MKRAGSLLVGILFSCCIGWLLSSYFIQLEWNAVLTNLYRLPVSLAVASTLLSTTSYFIFCTYDYLTVRSFLHVKRKPPLYIPAFLSYVVNLNFGSFIGGLGVRFKLYHGLGLPMAQVTKVVALSTLGHWLGFAILSGIVLFTFSFALPTLPLLSDYGQALGAAFLGSTLLLFWIAGSGQKYWQWRGVKWEIPNISSLMLRALLGLTNWLVVCFLLILIFSWHFHAPWQAVVTAYLISALGGVVSHIPAGLGVFEYFFLMVLTPHIARESVLSGMLSFRAIYYVVPLILSIPAYIWFRCQLQPRFLKRHVWYKPSEGLPE